MTLLDLILGVQCGDFGFFNFILCACLSVGIGFDNCFSLGLVNVFFYGYGYC